MNRSLHPVALFSLVASLTLPLAAQAQAPQAPSGLAPWLHSQKAICNYMLLNAVSPQGGGAGAVMASPSQVDPNYFYHWIRDAALVTRELVYLWDSARLSGDTKTEHEAFKRLLEYADFSRRNQLTPNPSGDAATNGLGEPKFMIDGQAYTDHWGRPQNDGPALRAITFMMFAERLETLGQGELVREKLFRPEIPAHTLIKADLEFVSHHWRERNVDLWEEVTADHFYTRLVQHESLVRGAKFVRARGDTAAADWYESEAALIADSLKEFWNQSKNILVVSRNISPGGERGKWSELDIAVVLGVLHADPLHGIYSAGHPHVLATVDAIVQSFQAIYKINQVRHDWDGEPMAPGIGRYPEDTYNGHTTQGTGNPWFLATHAVAEHHFKLIEMFKSGVPLTLTRENRAFYTNLLREYGVALDVTEFADGAVIEPKSAMYLEVMHALQLRGDSFLRRSRYQTDSRGNQSEQFNRDNGFMQGARDLTWSYASFLSVTRARAEAEAAKEHR